MKIEVYLQHIFQEYPVTESITIGVGSHDDPNWKKYERNCGCRGNVAHAPIDLSRINIQRVFLRSESFGGLLYDPVSAVIYKLDQEAYDLVKLLQQDEKVVSLKKNEAQITAFSKRHGIQAKALRELINQLEAFALW